jgi:hypothetical protein
LKKNDWLQHSPHMMGFRVVDDPKHRKAGRSMWHKAGDGWSISIPIPAWQSCLMRFTAWNLTHGIDYPISIRFSVAGQPGRMKINDHHELEAAVRTLQEPLLLMAGGTPLARRLLAGIK